MASRPAGIWVRVELFFNTVNGKEWSIIFWLKPAAFPTTGQQFDDAHDILVFLTNAFLPVTTADVTLVGTSTVFNDGTGSYGVEDYTSGVGSVAGNLVPEDVSLVVQRLTAAPGPTKRGRIFIAGIPESFVKGSYLSPTGETAFDALASTLNGPITATSGNYDQYHFSPTDSSFTIVTRWQAVRLLATNRKRRPRF